MEQYQGGNVRFTMDLQRKECVAAISLNLCRLGLDETCVKKDFGESLTLTFDGLDEGSHYSYQVLKIDAKKLFQKTCSFFLIHFRLLVLTA